MRSRFAARALPAAARQSRGYRALRFHARAETESRLGGSCASPEADRAAGDRVPGTIHAAEREPDDAGSGVATGALLVPPLPQALANVGWLEAEAAAHGREGERPLGFIGREPLFSLREERMPATVVRMDVLLEGAHGILQHPRLGLNRRVEPETPEELGGEDRLRLEIDGRLSRGTPRLVVAGGFLDRHGLHEQGGVHAVCHRAPG